MTALDEKPPREDESPGQAATDFAVLTTLLPRVLLASLAALFVCNAIRDGNDNESWDKAMFLAAIVLAALLCIDFLRRPPRRNGSIVVSVCATVGLVVGIVRVERESEIVTVVGRAISLPDLFWMGFGIPVAVAGLCLAFVLWRVLDRVYLSRPLRVALTTVIAFVIAFDIASLIRTVTNFAQGANNVFVLNEILAPAAGKVPNATFIPQYVSVYGWLLVPLRSIVTPWQLVQIGTIYLTGLGILSVVLAVAIAYRSMSSPSFWLAAGIVVPLTCVTVLHGEFPYSSIASYMQELPIRMSSAMILTFVGLEELARLRRGVSRTWHLPALGVLAGLMVWNSQDFGIAVTVALFLVLAVGLPRPRVGKSMSLWFAGVFVGLLTYPLLTVLAGTPIRLAYVGLFSRAFADGFASSPIQVPGPVVVVLPILVSSAAVGWCMLWRLRGRMGTDPAPYDRAVLTLAFVGTWATAGFAYYLNRSYASGQLQILLMPCGVCVVALVSLVRDLRAQGDQSVRTSVALFPLALIVSVGLASILISPYPWNTVRDLNTSPPGENYITTVIPLGYIHAAENYARSQGGSLAYFGNNGSYLHLETGIKNLLLYDDPGQFVSSPTLRNVACRYLENHASTFLLISPTDQSGIAIDLCGMYDPVYTPGIPSGVLFARNAEPFRPSSD